jgi:uncharacterized protein (DUF427 family)
MKACWRGHVIAESDDVVALAGYTYFPRAAVRMEYLRMAGKTESDLRCPHGVQFYDVTDRTHTTGRAAWSYEAPLPAYRHVDHWIGFWEDVELVD